MGRYTGVLGIITILLIAFLFSNNKKRINYRLVISGLLLQFALAILLLKIPVITKAFQAVGRGMHKIEGFAKEGANFVLGGVGVFSNTGVIGNYTNEGMFVFAINVTSNIILICILVALFYHFGIMQKIVEWIAKAMHFIMRVSGAEALSNIASVFVGQVEAQVLIRPYLKGMTKSELLASLSGSLACISGGILIVYVNMGARPEYLITASVMAAPGALVISKIIYPETEVSETMGEAKLKVESKYANAIDAVTSGAIDGFKIAVNVIAILIGFIALIAMVNWGLTSIHSGLTLDFIFGKIFYPFAWLMGIPGADLQNAATLLGQKLTINEFIAFANLTSDKIPLTTERGLLISSIALCGFANFASVGIQIGGIGALAPERRKDLAKLGLRALLAGTLASYMSAAIAGLVV